MALGAHGRVLAGALEDQLRIFQVGYREILRTQMNRTIAQGLQYGEDRFAVRVVGTDVVETGVDKDPGSRGQDGEYRHDGDAVVLDVLLHENSPLELYPDRVT
jgi:hypothetical protein